MARRYVALAAAACLALGAAACGGNEGGGGEPAAEAAAAAPEPSATAAEPSLAPRDGAGNGAQRPAPGARKEREKPERGRTAQAAPAGGEAEGRRRRSLERADRGREAEAEVERVVRRIVGMISAADKRVCRTSFTPRYAQLVSGERGDAAFRRCEADISRSKGTLEVVDFQETRVDGARASVRFRMRVPGAVTRQGWRLVRRGGGWLVDAKL